MRFDTRKIIDQIDEVAEQSAIEDYFARNKEGELVFGSNGSQTVTVLNDGRYFPEHLAKEKASEFGIYNTWPQFKATAMSKVGKRHSAGRILDGRTWDEFPIVNRGAFSA